MIEVKKTYLPNGEEGDCGYLNTETYTTFTANSILIPSRHYTLAVWVKSNTLATFSLSSGSDELPSATIEKANEWQKLKMTFISNGSLVSFDVPEGEYWLYEIKLEEGTIATSWTPSQKDADAEIQELRTEIKVTAEGLSTKVSKGEIISEINQSPEEISINANKINLNGAVTANENFKILEDGTMSCKNAEIIDGTISIKTDTKTEDVIKLSYEPFDNVVYSNSISPYGVRVSTYTDASNPTQETNAIEINPKEFMLHHWVDDNNYCDMYATVGGKDTGDAFYILGKSNGVNQYLQVRKNGHIFNTGGVTSTGPHVASSFRTRNNNVNIWEDSEGGNIEIHSGTGHTNSWQMDSVAGFLRFYTFRENDGGLTEYGFFQDGAIQSVGNRFVSSPIGDSCILFLRGFSQYAELNWNGVAMGVSWWQSDTKLKDNIKPTEKTALDKVEQIDFIQFDWKNGDGHVDLGVSANQLEEIMPDAVYEVEQPEESEYDSIKNIDTGKMTTYALKAIQELKAEVDSLKAEIEKLKGE